MRFKGLDLNMLVTLKVLLEEKSVSSAATKLNVTQPAISASLRKLREYFNDELLIVDGKKMLPSSHAIQIQPELNALLNDIDIFVSKTTHFSPKSTTRHFTLVANDYFCSVVLAPVIAKLIGQAPGVKIKIVPIDTVVSERLHKGEVDLVFSPSNTVDGEFHCEPLFQEELVLLACKKNVNFYKKLVMEDIIKSPQVLVDLTGTQRETIVQKKLNELGISINNVINLPSFMVAPELILNTNLMTIIPKRLALKLIQSLPLQINDLPDEIRSLTQFEYCAYSHPVRKNDAGLMWLKSLIRKQITCEN